MQQINFYTTLHSLDTRGCHRVKTVTSKEYAVPGSCSRVVHAYIYGTSCTRTSTQSTLLSLSSFRNTVCNLQHLHAEVYLVIQIAAPLLTV